MPEEEAKRAYYESMFNEIVAQEGQRLLGWRTVPVDREKLGKLARQSQPFIRQVFVAASDDVADELAFERKLYVIRKQFEKLCGKPTSAM
ncbi:hypothetical protein DI43_06165 [Geobacillus sp. CAMR12739]|nr:hypothetical protein DI43_06165 [Geobacillus sp. CAMR12739]